MISWETFEEGSVGEGFDESVNVGRTAAGKSGHGVEQSFLYLINDSDGAQKFLRKISVILCGMRAESEGGRTFTNEGWRVWHRSDDAGFVFAARLHGFDFDSGGDGNDQKLVRGFHK